MSTTENNKIIKQTKHGSRPSKIFPSPLVIIFIPIIQNHNTKPVCGLTTQKSLNSHGFITLEGVSNKSKWYTTLNRFEGHMRLYGQWYKIKTVVSKYNASLVQMLRILDIGKKICGLKVKTRNLILQRMSKKGCFPQHHSYILFLHTPHFYSAYCCKFFFFLIF